MSISPSLISFIGRSKHRRDILEKLKDKSLSQTEIRNITGMYKSHTSRTLDELQAKKLIVCLNPKDRAFKFYKITRLGIKVINETQRIIRTQ